MRIKRGLFSFLDLSELDKVLNDKYIKSIVELLCWLGQSIYCSSVI